jgi:hypothetical protein
MIVDPPIFGQSPRRRSSAAGAGILIARSVCGLSAALCVASCGEARIATPMPEPPAALDGSKIGLGMEPISIFSDPRPVSVVGQAGAAPAGARVRVLDLDSDRPDVSGRVQADGSFELSVTVSDGDELRLHAFDGAVRSRPLDLGVGPPAGLQPSPRHECLELTPGFELGFSSGGAAQSFTFRNACTATAILDTPRFRLGTSDAELLTPLPLELAPGETGALELGVPGAALLAEDVLFIDVDVAGRRLRYPLGLYGNGLD